uniref:phosphoserine phosphatase n=1 Tax=Eutreptiella gymnastica TaxID=73025 RepID=A0A7S1NU82_9EUGL
MSDITYMCRCDECRVSLFRGDNWYHKPGTNYDLCAKDFWKLPEAERKPYVNILDEFALGNQKDEYALQSQLYSGRCDQCRRALFFGDDWYHKTGPGNYDLCAAHWKQLTDDERAKYVSVSGSGALGDQKIQYILQEEVEERDSFMVVLDVEGTLMPEAWLELQKKTGIEGLKRTTAHEPDYGKLMRYRCDLLREHGITIKDMLEVVKDLKPLPGAREFLEWLKPLVPRVLLLTDTFEEYAMPMFEQLGYPCVFCNSLVVDEQGYITDHIMRLKDQKRRAVESFQRLNFRCIAVGDSFNDISMMTAAERGILIYPSERVLKAHPEFPVAKDHYDLRVKIGRIIGANKQVVPRPLVPRPEPLADPARMWLLVCPVAGFLAPEPWAAVADKTGLSELKMTSAMEPDFTKLMALRTATLRSKGIKLQEVVSIMDYLEPLPGAMDFLAWLKPVVPRTFMITDGPEDFALPIFDKLGHPMVFCNFLEADGEGYLKKLVWRIKEQKLKTMLELQCLNFRIIAVGTSFNDCAMLKASDKPILFAPSDQLRNEHPEMCVAANHEELKAKIMEVVGKPF